MTTIQPKQLPIGALVAADGICIAAAMIAAYYFALLFFAIHWEQNVAGYVQTAAITLPLWIGIHYLARLYDADIVGSGSDEYAQVLKAGAFGVVVMTTLSFWDRTVILSRGWIFISWALSLFLIISGRALLRGLLLRGRRRGQVSHEGP